MKHYHREVLAAPKAVAVDGRCTMGTFNQAIDNVNLLDVEQPLGFNAPRFVNYLRLKEWQAFQLSNEQWFICLAVYNTKSIGTAIIMAYNKLENRMYRYERKAPLWTLKLANGLAKSRSYYHGRHFSIDMRNDLDTGFFDITVSVERYRGLPDCQGRFRGFAGSEPIVIVQPFAPNRPLYSYKALMPVEGEFRVADSRSVFDRDSASMIVDDHKGFYPYVMQYDWVTGLGVDAAGRRIGFNLTDNQIKTPEKYNENCLWLDGTMQTLPPIHIKRTQGVEKPWQIHDDYGRVQLLFEPLQDVKIYLNLGIMVSRYHGPAGRLSGFIVDEAGKRVSFDGVSGMGEQKYIRM